MLVAKGWFDRRGIGSYCLMSMSFSLGRLRGLEMDDGGTCTAMGMYLMPWNCTLK